MRKKTYYGVTVGILMVDSSFRRFVGDIGNAQTWPFPVQSEYTTQGKMTSLFGLESDRFGQVRRQA